jgi:uncharacterized protein
MRSKVEKIKAGLSNYKGVVVAFSGGVDSSLLLKLATQILKKNVVAVTAVSPLHPKNEINEAKKVAKSLGCKHLLIQTHELTDPKFVSNTKNRCYLCKLELFTRIKIIAAKYDYSVIEGSNRSDLSDYRPGIKALKKLKVKSPFIEAGITKQEIRTLAKKLHLSNWNKPSTACLASRIPYGTKISKIVLQRIGKAEIYLGRLKLSQIRVRDHFPVARIEVYPREFNVVLKNRKKIVRYFEKLGYKYTVLDLTGFQTGSLNK